MLATLYIKMFVFVHPTITHFSQAQNFSLNTQAIKSNHGTCQVSFPKHKHHFNPKWGMG